MKTYTHIILHKEKLLAINAPNQLEYLDKFGSPHEEDYNKALQQAINGGCYFRNNGNVELLWWNHKFGMVEKNKPYPVPDGYEVKVEKEIISARDPNVWEKVTTLWMEEVYNSYVDYAKREYAILIPKQFHCGDEEDGDVRCEKQCDRCKGYKVEHGAGDDYPVTKEMQDKMDSDLLALSKQSLFKQQSIEEAAEAYIDKWNGGDILSSIENAYIAGAKSQAAEIERLRTALDTIRFSMYARETCDEVWHNIDKILTENGFPWVEDD